jgi:hypothetical protein
MKLKQKRGTQTWDAQTVTFLGNAISNVVSHENIDDYERIETLVGVVARLIDHMDLSDQQKLDIIEPYSNWELDK